MSLLYGAFSDTDDNLRCAIDALRALINVVDNVYGADNVRLERITVKEVDAFS